MNWLRGHWHIAAPEVCDGKSAISESRHRIPGASIGQPTDAGRRVALTRIVAKGGAQRPNGFNLTARRAADGREGSEGSESCGRVSAALCVSFKCLSCPRSVFREGNDLRRQCTIAGQPLRRLRPLRVLAAWRCCCGCSFCSMRRRWSIGVLLRSVARSLVTSTPTLQNGYRLSQNDPNALGKVRLRDCIMHAGDDDRAIASHQD